MKEERVAECLMSWGRLFQMWSQRKKQQLNIHSRDLDLGNLLVVLLCSFEITFVAVS